MKHLAGKVAVVTGGASGIGHAMATRFADAGMKLVLVDIESDTLDAAADTLRERGADVLAQKLDVADACAMDSLASNTLEHFGALHVLCNNAGVGAGGAIWELTVEDWEFALGANLWGVIHGVRVFTKHLIAQDEGHIINTASMAGLVSVPGMAPYNVTKHGVVTLSETLHHELAALDSNVGVSVLCPGHVNTQIWNSHRNRPEALSATGLDFSRPEMQSTLEAFRAMTEANLDPAAVADQVHDAILDGTFYIHTHQNHHAAVEARMRAILDAKQPAEPEGGQAVFTK